MPKDTPAQRRVKLALVDAHVARLVADFGHAVVQVFGVTDGAPRPDPLGTAFLVVSGSRRLLVTAAHVLEHRKDTTLYFGAPGERLREVLGQAYFSSPSESGTHRTGDEVDVAFVELAAESCESLDLASFIDPSDLDVDDVAAVGAVYVVLGYPLRKTYRKPGKSVHSTLYRFTVNSKPELYTLAGRDELTHLVLAFDRKRMNFGGTRQTAPLPEGMSGGPVFRLPSVIIDPSAAPRARLVALMTDFVQPHKVLVCPRISLVTAYARHAWDGIDVELPGPRRFHPVTRRDTQPALRGAGQPGVGTAR